MMRLQKLVHLLGQESCKPRHEYVGWRREVNKLLNQLCDCESPDTRGCIVHGTAPITTFGVAALMKRLIDEET